jgi:putative peptidoglycan lipid II flippase
MKSLARDVFVMALATAASRLLGLFRDVTIADRFGASLAYDAFLIAFFVPHMLRQLLAEGALSTAFVPLYAGLKASDQDADRFASNLLSLLMVFFPFVAALGVLLAPWYVPFLASGFSPEKMALTVSLARWVFPFIVLVGFGAVFMGILNAHHRFFAASFAPVWFNVGMILGAVVLAPRWPGGGAVYGLAAGVLLGGLGQMLSQLPSLRAARFRFRFHLTPLDPTVRQLVRRMLPAVFVLAVAQVNMMVDNKLASYLSDGSISALQYGMRLFQLPLGVLAVSIATALLPRLSVAQTEGDRGRFSAYFGDGLAAAAMVLLPAMAGLLLIGRDVVQLLFQHGSFSSIDTARTAGVLSYYAIGLVPYGWLYVQLRACYALGRTGLPLAAALFSVATNVALDLALVGPMKAEGLALATAAAGLVNAGVLLFLLRDWVDGFHLARRLALVLLGTAGMAAVVWAVRRILDSASTTVVALVPVVVGIAVYFAFVRATSLWHLARRRPPTP